MAQKRTLKVAARNLAFWESLCDIDPVRYLKRNDTVSVINESTVYGGEQGDREYYKVKHPLYGVGYMLKEGLEEVQNGGTG